MRELPQAHVHSLVCAIALAATVVPTAVQAAVGRTAGSAGVSQSGEASYSIPIIVPPGTHGMTLQLALVYGHRNGGTLIGAGWSIAGLSQISRCPRIWAADGEARDVRNDASDRFCLNGNKLRLTSGTYGQPNATYQTEIETFSRVTSHGAAGNGPAYFVVHAKDGLIYEFGNAADSRIESVGQPTARAWAVNKIKDRSGNAVVFTYQEDTTNGAYRIATIDYTQNTDQSLAPAYQVEFVWQTKPSNEIDSGYIAGSKVKEITRLDRIDIKYDTAVVRRYELTYEPALSSTSKSRLQSIQECAGSPLDCLPATTFNYQNGVPGLGIEVNTGAAVPTTPWPLDVNGDGRQDLVYSSSATSGSGTWMVMLANASGGYNAPINTGVTNTNYEGATPIDYNSDGLEDLLVPYSGGTWWVMLGSATGLSAPVNTGAPATGTGTNARAFDVNGDGLDDLVWADLVGYAGGDAVRYRLREPGGAFSATVSSLVGPYPADTRLENNVFGPPGQPLPQRVPDINGDGRGDLVTRRTVRVLNEETGTFTFFRRIDVLCPGAWAFTVNNQNAASAPQHGDFNGDGKSDLFYLSQTGSFVARFSTGKSLTAEVHITALGSFSHWAVLDWDSDGYDDILFSASGVWHLFRSTGEGFTALGNTGVSSVTQPTVADINGDALSDIAGISGGTLRYRVHSGLYPDLLQTATDGYGNAVTFNYAPLPSANYTKYSDAVFPEQDYQGPLYVVNTFTAPDGIGSTYTTSYSYYGATLHRQGRGLEGFYARRVQDSRNNPLGYDYFRRLFPYTGAVFQSDVYQPNGSTLISRTQNTWSTHSYGSGAEARSLPYASATTTTNYEVGGAFNGSLIRTVATTNSVDAASGVNYDTTTTTTEASSANGVQAGASYVQRVHQPTAYLLNDTTNWCIGRPGRIESTNSHNQYGGGALTRTTTIDWNASACRPTQITNEPGHAQLQVTQSLGYDGFGNVSSTSVAGIGMAARTSGTNWGTNGQFPVSATNALSQTTNFGWDYALGIKTSETDPNGIMTSWQYDAFGRRTRETRPDNTATTWSYADCATLGCVNSNNRMVIVQTALASGSATVTDQYVYADRFDRPIVTSGRALSGAYNRVAREYDALGRVARESAPCWWAGCTPFWTTLSYDALNRVTQVSRPVSDSDPSIQTTYTYHEALTTRVVDAFSKESRRVANAIGGLARSIDHDNYAQSFDYDPFGNPVRVMDSLGNTLLSNTFNIRGMRTAQIDLAAGNWTYVPNALNEITSQTDAKSQTTTFGYDALGRMTSRIEPEGTSTFTFGASASARNIGRLASMAGPGYSEGYTYDSIGRLQTRTITSDATYSIDYAYNSLGALHTLTYPTSTSSYRLKLQYDYQNGLLLRVKDFNAPATVFWTANDTDARGNLIAETLGNGIQTFRGYDQVTGRIDSVQSGAGGSIQNLSYTWDRIGNLTQRQDVRQGLIENFYYDNLHRLTSVTGPDPQTIGYDPRGNITSRTGGISSNAAHTITWYSYNLPNTISATANNSSQFFYAPDRSRWKQAASYGGTSEQTVYIGGLIEKVTLGTTTSWKHSISAGGRTVALYVRKSTGTNELRYLSSDHLGSIDAVTDASANVIVRLSFGIAGQRRSENTWNGNPTSGDWTGITNTTRRGFTFHEMLDNLNMTHMNGRLYDQLIARFISADPLIDGVDSTQGWNRYSYVHNSPLSFTDPSGHGSVIISWINRDLPDWFGDRIGNRSGFSGDGGGGGGGGGRGRGGPPGGGDDGDDADDSDDDTEPDDKCWNGEQGNLADLADGLVRQILNDITQVAALAQAAQNPVQAGLGLLPPTPNFGSNDTNMGILGSDLAPAAELTIPIARLGYVIEAGRIPGIVGITAPDAVVARNGLKATYRLGLLPNWQMSSYDVFRAAGKTDAQIIASAGRTNPAANTAAAAIAGAAAVSISNGGCP